MRLSCRVVLMAAAMLLTAASMAAPQAKFLDTLDQPAPHNKIAPATWISAVATAGKRVVAVGQSGLIMLSDDAGATWQQQSVPVASDLVAVHFPTPLQGWAVGHDCIILHTIDGGKTWTKQLDGRQVLPIIAAHYEKAAANDSRAVAVQKNIAVAVDQSATKGVLPLPLLDVWFQDERVGYVVGAFNLIFRTVDGGKTWEPLQDRTENPRDFHLYSVRGSGDEVYIVGEQGLVLKLDRNADRFTALPVPYKGSFFGLLIEPEFVAIYGMRGNVFVSRDSGKSFVKLNVDTAESFVGGVALADGRLALILQNGKGVVSDVARTAFTPAALPPMAPVSGVAAIGPSTLVLATMNGLKRIDIK